MANIADYDWCDAFLTECTGHCESERHEFRCDCVDMPLHAPHPDAAAEFDQWDGDAIESTTLCGIGYRLTIPGPLSRMGGKRCVKCCELTGLPTGVGSPKNDNRCRVILGLEEV